MGAALLLVLGLGACARETTPRPTPVAPAPLPTAALAPPREPRAAFAEAVQLVARDEHAAARPIFTALLASYPALEDYHLAYLAEIEDESGRLAEAAALDDRLIRTHPESVWMPLALARRARVALALGDPAAPTFAARALAAPGADAQSRAVARLVEADFQAAHAPRQAYAIYREVRAAGGAAAARARAQSTRLETLHPELLADTRLQLDEAQTLAAEGRLDLAAERYATVAQRGTVSEQVEAWRGLARVRKLEGRIEEAVAAYETAARLDPGSIAAFELAILLWNRDRDAEARERFLALLRARPDHPERDTMRYALGRIATQAGRHTQAAEHFERLLATGRDAELKRDARWRLAWMRWVAGDLRAAARAFTTVGRMSGRDRAAALYWQGRIRERLGDPSGAAERFRAVLAREPEGYYADLAETRLGISLPPPPTPILLGGEPPLALTARDYHWSRSQELGAAGLDRAAARELDALARDLGASEPYLVEAYRTIDAHDRALRLAARLGSALPERSQEAYAFPRAYWETVAGTAATERLDPYLLLAIIRQESRFDPTAVSPANAHGLMQLLPRTAQRVGGESVTPSALHDPSRNVALGARYLRELLDRYAGSIPKALAAYNGGEDAVAKWEARAPGAPLDEFVETISFRETRDYVKKVIANYRHYRRLYGAPGERRALDVMAAAATR